MARRYLHPLAVPAALLSAGVLAFEICLMRLLLAASWHHFAFVVLSVALLSFGASGTFLTIARIPLLRRAHTAIPVLFVCTAVAMPLAVTLAGRISIEARFLPAILWQQIGHWMLYWMVLGVPLFAGATATGLVLMHGADAVASLYAANLLGSGIGALLAPVLMPVVPPQWLGHACSVPALAGCALLMRGVAPAAARFILPVIGAAAVAACTIVLPPRVGGDPWKFSAHLQRLADQGSAARLAVRYSPRSTIELYRSDTFHDLPLLAGTQSPPPLDAIVIDGHLAGWLLRIGSIEQAAFLDDSMIAATYALAPRAPRVLLAGETGCANVWLAARRGARRIDVVQSDPGITAIIGGRPPQEGAAVLHLPQVRIVHADPRHFVEHRGDEYDLIQLVTLESAPAGGGGMAGLAQDYLITVEGLAACLRRLAPEGVLVAARGIQNPPRDNLKLLATLMAALRTTGVVRPEDHLVVFRDFQWVCTVVSRRPWSDAHVDAVRALCRDRQLTPVWYRGIRADELNQPDALPSPPGSKGDWYHYAVAALAGAGADRFIRDWPFDIRPPTDDRPFFRDFCRLWAVNAMRRAMGEMWLTRTETAFLFVCAAAVVIAVAGLALIVVPLALAGDVRRQRGKAATAVYFSAIGLAYMLLETMAMTRMSHLVGDALYAASVTICSFLIFSSIGSALAGRLHTAASRCALIAVLAVPAAALLFTMFQPAITAPAARGPLAMRCAVAAIAIAPAAILMGIPMPLGLRRLHENNAPLIPWAWGVNGFASVLAAPLAMVISMTGGFVWTGLLAVLMYVVAATVAVVQRQCRQSCSGAVGNRV